MWRLRGVGTGRWWRLSSPLFGGHKKVMGNDFKYSRNTNIPQYVPKSVPPSIDACYDYKKYLALLKEIEQADVSDDEKRFLRHAASRHIVFDYARIADYYAHATPKMQRLMEQSALVILDIDDAIAQGYVKLSKRMEEIRNDGKLAQKARDFR